ncbi:hypothetical protein AB9K41_22010, partial [Cribrihabitans sp. XS_ASV171]
MVNTTILDAQSAPKIATLSDGKYVITWTDQSATAVDTSLSAVRGQIFTATGTKFGSEFVVNTTASNHQFDSDVAALPDGGFVVTWTDESQTGGDTSGSAVRGQVFASNGSKVGSEFLVNTETTLLQTYSSVTALSDGSFVVAWKHSEVSVNDIRAQLFSSTGTKIGTEFIVNSLAGSQYSPSLAALADGRFVAGWATESDDGDASALAVNAQIFDPRDGQVHMVTGHETQPQLLDRSDVLQVLTGASLVGVNAATISTRDDLQTSTNVQVNGAVSALSSGTILYSAIALRGTFDGTSGGFGGHIVTVTGNGLVNSSDGFGILMLGSFNELRNAGEISARTTAVKMTGAWSELENTGLITGNVEIDGPWSILHNSGTITGGLSMDGSSGGPNEIVNTGLIEGDILLGDGAYVFDGRGGRVLGEVLGGTGNDRYIVDDGLIALVEDEDEG